MPTRPQPYYSGLLVASATVFSWERHFPVCRQIASKLGSDINFFLEGHTPKDSWVAWCTGRGEKITPLDTKLDCWVVLVHPPVGCSTKEVFSRLRIGEKQQRKVVHVVESLQLGQIEKVADSMFNDLEWPASQVTPYIERSRNWIDRYDHLGQCMSGSGSARFCLCDSKEQAEKIANNVRLSGARAYVVRPWDQPSLMCQLQAMWLS